MIFCLNLLFGYPLSKHILHQYLCGAFFLIISFYILSSSCMRSLSWSKYRKDLTQNESCFMALLRYRAETAVRIA